MENYLLNAQDKLPPHITYGDNLYLDIIQKPLKNKLGCLDTRTNEIFLESNQNKVEKHIILLHELIHFVAEQMKEKGIIKKQPDEKFVTNLACNLFQVLALSNLWNGVNPQEYIDYV